jgi:hypothetical protein
MKMIFGITINISIKRTLMMMNHIMRKKIKKKIVLTQILWILQILMNQRVKINHINQQQKK